MPCTHIGLISSNLTQSGLDLDHTLLQMLCTHIRLSSSHLTKKIRIGLYPSHRLVCQPFDTIRFGSYPPPHTMYTHKIDFQPFDTGRQVWNIILPPHAEHTYGIYFQPFDKIGFASYPPPHAMHTQDSSPAI